MGDRGLELLDEPVAQELLRSQVPARLAYSWTDGTPRVVPIWFHWDGASLIFASFASAPKVTAISSGDSLAATIDTNDYPHRVLLVRGSATVDRVDGVVPEYAAAARRYFGDEQGEAWIAGLPKEVSMVRISLRPDHVSLLDFEYRFPSALAG